MLKVAPGSAGIVTSPPNAELLLAWGASVGFTAVGEGVCTGAAVAVFGSGVDVGGCKVDVGTSEVGVGGGTVRVGGTVVSVGSGLLMTTACGLSAVGLARTLLITPQQEQTAMASHRSSNNNPNRMDHRPGRIIVNPPPRL